METIKAECSSCDGTGLYRGVAEKPGTAVVCLTCKGTGCRDIDYTPFSSRKRRSDVREVLLSRGSFIFSCGPIGKPISYEEFLSGKMPVEK